MRAVPVQPEDAWMWRTQCEWHFRSFCRGGQWQPEDLWSDIVAMKRQMWIAEDDGVKAVVLTCVSDDRAQSCIVTHAAGEDRADWLHLWAVIEAWAKDIGCQRIEAVCRPGWEPDLKTLGLRKRHVVMEKRL